MRSISVRDPRWRSGQVWKELAGQREMAVTSNGKPIALLCSVTEDSLDDSVQAARTARAVAAAHSVQRRAREQGMDKMTLDDINAEIAAVRTTRRREL